MSTIVVMVESGQLLTLGCILRELEAKKYEQIFSQIFTVNIDQAADKLFDDIHWLIVHSLKAVQVSIT